LLISAGEHRAGVTVAELRRVSDVPRRTIFMAAPTTPTEGKPTAHAPLRGPRGTVHGPHAIYVIVVCEPAFDENGYNPHEPGSPLSPVMTVHRTLEESEVSTFGHHVRDDRTWRLLPGWPRPRWTQEVHMEIGCELDDDEELRSRVLARIKSLWGVGWWIDRAEYRESPKPMGQS
jgi:hypothetical protein